MNDMDEEYDDMDVVVYIIVTQFDRIDPPSTRISAHEELPNHSPPVPPLLWVNRCCSCDMQDHPRGL